VRYPQVSEDALFVDIDYPDLMRKKRAIVLQTPELRDLLGADVTISENDKDPILLRSSKYCQLACDLRELEHLRQTLDSILRLEDAQVLFVAEVSITYMDTVSADALIQWASGIGKGE
jgi:tRNA wybutosine-synthesizing protein 4